MQRPVKRGSALGWSISLLAHALAIAWMWHTWPTRPADGDTAPRRRIEVRLAPLAAPAQPPVPAPVAVAPHREKTSAAPALRTRVGSTPVPAPSLPDVAPLPAPAGEPAAATPTFDIAAARATARMAARDDGRGLVALPTHKPELGPDPGERIQERLEHARRVDCKTINAESTNILVNAVVLAKNIASNVVDDSGCKW
jgi:hypothetical protein